jgi:hypothetical protein
MSFKIKAIQVDRGFEFYSDLESYCTEKGIRLFVLPTKSPKHNGAIERLLTYVKNLHIMVGDVFTPQ